MSISRLNMTNVKAFTTSYFLIVKKAFRLKLIVLLIMLYYGCVQLGIAQSIHVIPNPDAIGDYSGDALASNNKLYFQYTGSLGEYDGSSIKIIRDFTGQNGVSFDDFNLINFKGKLYLVCSGVLFEYDGIELTTVSNPLGGGFIGALIVYNDNLYCRYEKGINSVTYLAEYNGDSIKIIPNPDNGYGVERDFIIFNNTLCFSYLSHNTNQLVNQLAQYDGISIKLISNPDSGDGYGDGSPIVYNNKLYDGYRNNSRTRQLAQYDGANLTLISPPNNGQDYRGFPIIYNGKLYLDYPLNTFAGQLGIYDGDSITVIRNIQRNDSYEGSPVVYNGALYFQYAGGNLHSSELVKYDGNTFTEIPNPDNVSYISSENTPMIPPVVFDNKLYLFYYSESDRRGHLGVYDGSLVHLIPNPDAGYAFEGGWVIYNNGLYFDYRDSLNRSHLATIEPLTPVEAYSEDKPLPGDVIIYWGDNGGLNHSGQVETVDGYKVTTIIYYSQDQERVLIESPDAGDLKHFGSWTIYHTDRKFSNYPKFNNNIKIVSFKLPWTWLSLPSLHINEESMGLTDNGNANIFFSKGTGLRLYNCHGFTFDRPIGTTILYGGIIGYRILPDGEPHYDNIPNGINDQSTAAKLILKDNGYRQIHATGEQTSFDHYNPLYNVNSTLFNIK